MYDARRDSLDDDPWADDARTREPMRPAARGPRRNPSREDRSVRRRMRRAGAQEENMPSPDRSELLQRIESAKTLDEQMRLVAQLDQLDQAARRQASIDKELDLAGASVREAMTPVVSVTAKGTTASDWLDTEVADAPFDHGRMVAEAALWFQSVPDFVKADKEEFDEQALGKARQVTSSIGAQGPVAENIFLGYATFLRGQSVVVEAASGVDQIQQTTAPDGVTQKPTPLDPTVFDNFAPPVNEFNAPIIGTETSDRAPAIQQAVNGGGNSSPEVPGGHQESGVMTGPAPEPSLGGGGGGGSSSGAPMAGVGGGGGNSSPERAGGHSGTSAVPVQGGPGNMDEGEPAQEETEQTDRAGQAFQRGRPGKAARRVRAAAGDPSQRMIDRMQAVGDPHKEGYAYLQDGGHLCPGCSAKEGGADAAGPHKPLSWSDLRHHYPHGVTCDNCMQELTEERPHTEHECEYGEDCSYNETNDAFDSHVPEGQHHDWGGHDDFKTTLMGHQDWQNTVNQRGKDAQHGEKAINDLFSGPQWDHAKNFLHNNPGGATHMSVRQHEAASGLQQVQQTTDVHDAHRETPLPTTVAFPWLLDEDEQAEGLSGNAHYDQGGEVSGGHQSHASLRRRADTYTQPAQLIQPNIANSPATTPPRNPSEAGDGAADARDAGAAPSFGDAHAAPEYTQAYTSAPAGPTAQNVPVSIGGDNGQSLKHPAFASRKIASREDMAHPEFRRGYKYAARWIAGTPVVRPGSPELEAGIYAGFTDNAQHRKAWISAHGRLAGQEPALFRRIVQHRDLTHKVASQQALPTDGTYLQVEAATGIDLDTTNPTTSPSPTGDTPINGPGKPGPLAGGMDAAAPGGASPYNGAAPLGQPVVPPGQPVPQGHPVTIPDTGMASNTNPGSGLSTLTAAFRRRVQAGLLSEKKGA